MPAPATHKNDGLHTVSYYSIDNAGNGDSSLARQVTVRIDTTRPAFSLRSAARVSVRRGHALSLRYRARDAGGTCKLVVTLSRKVGKQVVKYTYTLSTRHVSSWQTHKLYLTRPCGTYTAVLRLRDPAGNLGRQNHPCDDQVIVARDRSAGRVAQRARRITGPRPPQS